MPILEGKGVTKYFGGLAAVFNVDFDVEQGEVLVTEDDVYQVVSKKGGEVVLKDGRTVTLDPWDPVTANQLYGLGEITDEEFDRLRKEHASPEAERGRIDEGQEPGGALQEQGAGGETSQASRVLESQEGEKITRKAKPSEAPIPSEEREELALSGKLLE